MASCYLKSTGREELADLATRHAQLLASDPEVERSPEKFYDEIVEIDLSRLEPHIVGPHTPDLARPISQMGADVAKHKYPARLSSALIGSCTNSSYEDLSRAADVARQAAARGVKSQCTLWVSPGSEQIHQTIKRDGQLTELEAIGGTVRANACGRCIGQWKPDDVAKGEANPAAWRRRKWPARRRRCGATCSPARHWSRRRALEGGLPGLGMRQWLGVTLLGATGVAAYNLFFMFGLKSVPAGRAALIVALNPAVTLLGAALFFGEPLLRRKLAGIALALAGAAIVIGHGNPFALLDGALGTGEALILGCAISWSAFTLIAKHLMAGLSPLAITTYVSLTGTLMLAAATLVEGALHLALQRAENGQALRVALAGGHCASLSKQRSVRAVVFGRGVACPTRFVQRWMHASARGCRVLHGERFERSFDRLKSPCPARQEEHEHRGHRR